MTAGAPVAFLRIQRLPRHVPTCLGASGTTQYTSLEAIDANPGEYR